MTVYNETITLPFRMISYILKHTHMKAKKILSGFLFALFVLFSLTQCETDQTSLLTSDIWNFANMTTDSENEDVQGFVALGKALLTDATLELQSGGTYILDSPLLVEPITGTWSLVGDDQLIRTPDGELPTTANIETLTKKELKYIETYPDTNLGTYSVTYSWNHH